MFNFIKKYFKRNKNINDKISNNKEILNNIRSINKEDIEKILNEYEKNNKIEWPFK